MSEDTRILQKLQNHISKVIIGKEQTIELLLVGLAAGGHVLLEDVPGTGKTVLAKSLAASAALKFSRIQFTPDLLPSDVTGLNYFDQSESCFVFRPGPVFCNILLADEINRATPRTQSALLEAMEERQVTVDGVTRPLPKPFLVIATQNSVGAAGTPFLPYAQMDRFLVRLSLGYPDYDAQMAMLRDRQGRNPLDGVQCVLRREELAAMQQEAGSLTVRDAILDYITRLTMASRSHAMLRIGISPRGALFLDRAAKAHAYLEGRDYVTGSDVQAVFTDVCAHRVLLKEEAEGLSAEDVLRDLLRTVENPDRRCVSGLKAK